MAVDPALTTRLDAYLAAELAVLQGGQVVNVNGISYTLGNLKDLQSQIKELRAEIAPQTYGGSSNRARFGPRD